MGLHLLLYVLDGQNDLSRTTTPMTRLGINEHMGLNRLLIDVGPYGKDQHGVVPLVTPRPILRGFKLSEVINGGPDDQSPAEFDTDVYGKPLTWLYADEFSKIFASDEPGEHSTFRIRGALAYIAELPPNTPVVLFWG